MYAEDVSCNDCVDCIQKLNLELSRRYNKQNTKLPKQHHDNEYVNVEVYQVTKLDAQGHTTDTLGDRRTALERSATNVTGGLNQGYERSTSPLSHH